MTDSLGARSQPLHRRVRPARARFYRRRILAVLAVLLSAFLLWLAISLGGALTNPALGSSVGARLAEWARSHGGASAVNWIENEWYTHHAPPRGGKPPPGSIHRPVPAGVPATAAAALAHLPTPGPIVPPASPPIPGEGQWSPVGRPVGGIPAVYVTTLRPDPVHTSYVVGVAWMDTKLLKATLYSGSQIPGGGPFTHTAPVGPAAATGLVAAFNAGFLMSASDGGYYTDGRAVVPLRPGAASFVVHADGQAAIGAWGSEVSMAPDVVSVRQNLDLVVDNGRPAAGLDAADTRRWGATLGNAVYVWRSGVGVTANGALVYVGGPGLNITDLADLLVRAGAVRAMELDINTDWVHFSSYAPVPATGAATALNGTDLLPDMVGTPGRYFESWWSRDFITMSSVRVSG